MNFKGAVGSGFRRYFDFRTRSSRSEYWWWFLLTVNVSIVSTTLDEWLFGSMVILDSISSLAILIPSLAVAVRRLHDVNRSGWWYLTAFTVLGIIFPLLYWFIRRGTQGPNRYGLDPLQPQTEPAREDTVIQETSSPFEFGHLHIEDRNYCHRCGA